MKKSGHGASNAIFFQTRNLASKSEFEVLARTHYSDRTFKSAYCWPKFVAMVVAQISERRSICPLISNPEFLAESRKSLQQILNLLQKNIIEKWRIHGLLKNRSAKTVLINPNQLYFSVIQ